MADDKTKKKKYDDDHPFADTWNAVTDFLAGSAEADEPKKEDKIVIDPDKAKAFREGFGSVK